MKVKLINHTPEPEKTVAAAARLCYSASGAERLMEELPESEIGRLIKMLIGMGHLSTVEHVSFTFAIEGISRNLSHQLVRHRIASYSQKSQRYVNEQDFNYIIPPSIEKDEKVKLLFQTKMQEIQALYEELAAVVPKEDARYVLPGACETKIVATFNARSLLNFFAHRLCKRAQWEIRSLAQAMLKEVRRVAPNIFLLAGPSCVTEGVCYEGKMSCGRVKEIRERIPRV